VAAHRLTRIVRAMSSLALLTFAPVVLAPAALNAVAGAQTGSVVIMLQTDPDGEAGSFSFTHTVVSAPVVASPFVLTDGVLQFFGSVPVGSYTVTMEPPSGWEIAVAGDTYDTGCWDDGSGSTVSTTTGVATLNVTAGGFLVCTYVVRKATTPPPAGDVVPLFTTPRGIGYWKNWGGCTVPPRPHEMAARETALYRRVTRAGSDLYPLGALQGLTCVQGTHLLSREDFNGTNRANDAAYNLAAQLVAAHLNKAAGVPIPACLETAMNAAEAMLTGLGFDGTGDYLGPRSASGPRKAAQDLAAQLHRYNDGGGSCS
jgi:hypothetical protein